MQPIDSQRPKQAVFDYALTLEDKPEVHEKFKFTTVKGSQFKQPFLNSQALAQAAVKHLMQSLLHSFSATECLSLTQQAVHQFGVHLLLQHLIQMTKRVTVLLGRTHSSKITQSLVFGMTLAQKHIRDRLAADAQVLLDTSVTRRGSGLACRYYIKQ